MIAKVAFGSLVASLLAVLAPLAAVAGVFVAGVFAAVFWMVLVHRLIARVDRRDGAEHVFLVAEAAPVGRDRLSEASG